ncbi:hypothetical protein BP5796_12579 [Coleophoma crateriformis]|uniref:Transcription factor domain-containing protein n=1 Tax=Coleophoma crateriformis TaxID=565419 RepID=A0A3D8Q823_9HELO|nr:hypothetical protein BP5796_12579 [Coleophoma crateriformis]
MSRPPRSTLAVSDGVTPQNLDQEQGHQVLGPSSRSSSSVQTPLSDIPASSPRSSLFKKPVIGYVTTQFNAVFLENKERFCFGSVLSPTVGESVENDTAFVHNKPSPSSNNDNKTQLGIDILRRFPTLRTQQTIINFLDHYPDPWISPKMIRHCLSSTCSELQHSRTAGTLTMLSSEICANGETPIHLEGADAWYNWFSGSKLRWEMIGILFTIFGMAFYSRQEWDPVFSLPEQGGRNRKTAAMFMRVCASECLQMCRETDLNDMIVVLTKNLGRLESVLVGDDIDKITTCTGSLTSSFMAVGLHRLPKPTTVTPLSEWRNGISSSAYCLDKLESIFYARPPYLNRLYCTYQMPLDLGDDELYSGHAVFEAAVKSLDANGWNTKNKIYTNTWSRARCYLAPIWEDILEKSLGVDIKFSCSDIDKVIERLDQIEESYPRHIRYSNISEWCEQQGGGSSEIYLTTGIHLDILQCRFLLERLKVSRGFASEQKLLEVAQQMMAAVLSLWLNRDRLVNHLASFDWLIMRYGVPSAGVLCVELLKSTKGAPGTQAQPVHFSRSEVVQSLTMFLGFVDWIRPSDGNYGLCRRLRQVIKGILDCVLDSTLPPQSDPIPETDPQTNRIPTDGNGDLLLSSTQMLMIDGHATDWLNTIDWTQGDWLDFNISTLY